MILQADLINFFVPINIMNVYLQPECRLSKEKEETTWNAILEELSKIESRGKFCVLVGDMDCPKLSGLI